MFWFCSKHDLFINLRNNFSGSYVFRIALTKLKVVSWLNASILSGVRIIIGPIIGFSFIQYLNLSGVAAGVLLIQSAMPSAILTYLVGSMYSEKGSR